MGRMTMFDDLDDASPPTPGLREFALVTERARAIRRRRAAVVTWSTVASVVVAVTSTAWLVQHDVSDRRVVSVPISIDGGPVETTAPPSTAEVPPSSTEVGRHYTFDEATEIADLPALTVTAPLEALQDPTAPGLISIVGDADGRTCIQIDGGATAEACVDRGAPFASLQWTPDPTLPTLAPGRDDQLSPERLLIVVDADVQVAFFTVGGSCSVTRFGEDAPVQLWLCRDLDPSAAYVEVVGPNQIVIGTTEQRG